MVSVFMIVILQYCFLCHFYGIPFQCIVFFISKSIDYFICEPQLQHLIFILMQQFCKFNHLLSLSPSVATFNFTEHGSVYF